ncbi:hypothetical protein [Alistipes sp. An54]|uniref:hypothetical protein n=1 Tax=Alistipes sp. An54 TaxID=1965645 RepID=UPI0019D19FD1|nr:hypothetical protein [Alistipes sp. An54]
MTKSLVYPLMEKYYSSGDLPSDFYKREGLSESQFYTRRQRYPRDHPSVAKKLGVVLKPTHMPSRSPRTQASSGESASPSNSDFVRVDTIKGSSLFAEAVADYELCYPNGVRLRVTSATPADRLSTLIKLY